MWQPFTPHIYQTHQKRLSKEIQIEYATNNQTSRKQQDCQPQEIGVSISRKDLGLHLIDGDVGEVDAEKKREIEFAHKE